MDIETINPKNIKITKEFEKLVDQIKIQMDIAPNTHVFTTNGFRLKQILIALQVIKLYPDQIKSGEQLKDFKGIGKGTINRINEILKTGFLSEIKISKSDQRSSEYVENLEQVHGIGHSKAYELVTEYGIKSVEELLKAYNKGEIELSNVILTSLKYYKLYQQKIPRSEVDEIKLYLEGKINKFRDWGITICGSYRRLKPYSNDVDVLLTNKKVKSKMDLEKEGMHNSLYKFVELLTRDKFILDDLTDKDYQIKYMGYCKFGDNPVRRIDIRYIPYISYPAALLYFTGSAEFNKKMRRWAIQLGYTLNEYGLYEVEKSKDKKLIKTKLVKTKSEKDIFDKLGMEYLPPESRI
jgi:DNA polymerase beta